MIEAQQATHRLRTEGEESDTYWFKRCYELEIGWVCNVVSALLVHQGRDPIVPVTARDHALFSLQRMIESFGPTADYEHWKKELGK